MLLALVDDSLEVSRRDSTDARVLSGVKATQLAIAICLSGHYLSVLDLPDFRR